MGQTCYGLARIGNLTTIVAALPLMSPATLYHTLLYEANVAAILSHILQVETESAAILLHILPYETDSAAIFGTCSAI